MVQSTMVPSIVEREGENTHTHTKKNMLVLASQSPVLTGLATQRINKGHAFALQPQKKYKTSLFPRNSFAIPVCHYSRAWTHCSLTALALHKPNIYFSVVFMQETSSSGALMRKSKSIISNTNSYKKYTNNYKAFLKNTRLVCKEENGRFMKHFKQLQT